MDLAFGNNTPQINHLPGERVCRVPSSLVVAFRFRDFDGVVARERRFERNTYLTALGRALHVVMRWYEMCIED